MNGSACWVTMLRSSLLAAGLLIAAGCATSPAVSPPPASAAATAGKAATGAQAPAYVADETPASESELVQSADFTRNAYREGFKPEIRNGAVVYCWTDDDIGSRLPTKKCVNQAQAELLIQQRQAQRDALQRMNSGCTPGINCAN